MYLLYIWKQNVLFAVISLAKNVPCHHTLVVSIVLETWIIFLKINFEFPAINSLSRVFEQTSTNEISSCRHFEPIKWRHRSFLMKYWRISSKEIVPNYTTTFLGLRSISCQKVTCISVVNTRNHFFNINLFQTFQFEQPGINLKK